MNLGDILNLLAIIIVPIAAVLVGQHLQNKAEIRKDKMHVFKVLMTFQTNIFEKSLNTNY